MPGRAGFSFSISLTTLPELQLRKSGFMSYRIICIFILAGILSCCGGKDEAYDKRVQNPEVLHRSVKKITDIIVYDIFSPPVASRIYAYASVAAYEALIRQDKNYISLAG